MSDVWHIVKHQTVDLIDYNHDWKIQEVVTAELQLVQEN